MTPSSPAPKHAPVDGVRPRFRVHTEDEAELRAAAEDVAAGRMVELSEDELAEWERTGELPSSVQERFAALECGVPRG